MGSLLNRSRPPVFCPGCAHERIAHALDQTFQKLHLSGEEIVIVSDIGCSGLFDTFFNTHAVHGLHGRALTYATGIKMARPNLKVVVTMGDGGLGIGGAHVLSTSRRNIDLTLLILNNFNYGMTGGQCSCTTPQDAQVASGFLNSLEKPIDICEVAAAAGAVHVTRASTYEKALVEKIEEAIRFEGFSMVDIWGICPGRYTKRNKLTPQSIESALSELPPLEAAMVKNARMEYGRAYREAANRMKPPPPPLQIPPLHEAPSKAHQEVLLLGGAGQRIRTAGELLCLAAASAGLYSTQKNDYPITVMRGHSVTEVILDRSEIGYTGIEHPTIVIALAQEGVDKRKAMFSRLSKHTWILKVQGIVLPPNAATLIEVDFRDRRLKSTDWALASLALFAHRNAGWSKQMLLSAIELRLSGEEIRCALEILHREWALE